MKTRRKHDNNVVFDEVSGHTVGHVSEYGLYAYCLYVFIASVSISCSNIKHHVCASVTFSTLYASLAHATLPVVSLVCTVHDSLLYIL
jgi:hypothetical protein